MTDITILTCEKYLNPKVITPYEQNILDEYQLLKEALEAKGLSVDRTNWDNADYDFSITKAVVFRTIWDYFERFEEFSIWLDTVSEKTKLINPLSLLQWNIDKHYLQDLESKGVAVVPTYFSDTGSSEKLIDICKNHQWTDVVIKPAISGAAFHTYKIKASDISEKEKLFASLVAERDMLVQPFITTITERGEASLMVFNGKCTHAILKKAKAGDFRVQDDFGGTVHAYEPSQEEINFAEKVFASCHPVPAYGRVDIVWNEHGNHLLSELEIIEPELWIRNHPPAAKSFAEGIVRFLD